MSSSSPLSCQSIELNGLLRGRQRQYWLGSYGLWQRYTVTRRRNNRRNKGEKEGLGKIVNTQEFRVIQRTEQFAAEWGIGRYMLSKCWVLRMGTTRAINYQQRVSWLRTLGRAKDRAEIPKEWPK